MWTTNVDNGVDMNQSQNDNISFINVECDNQYKYPLSFDVLFFTSPATINGETFYRLFVRLNYMHSKDALKLQSINSLLLGTSNANFQLINSSGTNTLKTIDGESTLTFGATVLSASYTEDARYSKFAPRFYCLQIPVDKFKWGEMNKIRFSANISSYLWHLSEAFTGVIWINGLNEYRSTQLDDNTYNIERDNLVEGYFNGTKLMNDDPYGIIHVLKSTYLIKNKSIYDDDIFFEDYSIKTKTTAANLDQMFIDNTTMGYLLNEQTGVSALGHFDLSSSMELNVNGEKLSDYYDIKKQHNTMNWINQNELEIINDDYTYLDPNTSQVKQAAIGETKGVIINPNIDGSVVFKNSISINGFAINITNSVAANLISFDIIYDDDLDLQNIAVTYDIDVTTDEVAAYTADDFRKYFSDHEKIS